jgi:prevent-host-death family protein
MLEMIPITRARADFLPLVKQVSAGFLKFAITKQGKPIAVVLNYEEYARMAETLAVISDDRLIGDIREGLRQIERGQIIPLEETVDK